MTCEVMGSRPRRAQNRAVAPGAPPMRAALLVLALVALGALSAVAVARHGYVGIFTMQLQTAAGLQVLVDLIIALVLVMVWMVHDARRTGRNPWPWLAATLALGSFGPLGYLLVGELRARRGAPAAR